MIERRRGRLAAILLLGSTVAAAHHGFGAHLSGLSAGRGN